MPWTRFFVLLLVGLGAGCSASAWTPHAEPNTLLGRVVRARREQGMTGDLVSIPSPGNVTLVDVWSTDCPQCLRVMPEYESLWRRYKDSGLRVVGVAVDDNPGIVAQKVRELGITYPVVIDPEGAIRGSLHVAELPGVIVIDRAGTVRTFRQGAEPADQQELREAVEALVTGAVK